MFVDASALLAILLEEPEAGQFTEALAGASSNCTSPIALFETVAGLMRARAVPKTVAEETVRAILGAARIEVISVDDETGRTALDAFEQFGKGRHPAQLNMGDCFAYACAKLHGLPLLYKGDDFRRTDLA